MKVVINADFGGFSLSKEAFDFLSISFDRYGYKYADKEMRDNPKLVECVEKLGEKANGLCAKLKVVEIPDDVEWELYEYDGFESIHEKHRVWK